MEHDGFLESDWKQYRKHIATWQENYMKRMNEEYVAILTRDKNPAENFWDLEKRIHADKKKPGVLIDSRRSKLIENILELLYDEAITMDDLDDFSDVFKETIQFFTNPNGKR